MHPEPLSLDDAPADGDTTRRRLSQNGQILGIVVYGGLVVAGFFFGVVTGYDSPKPSAVAKKEKEQPKAEAPKVDPTKPTPKLSPEPRPEPKVEPKKPDSEREPPKPEPKKDEPTPEPKKVDSPMPKTENLKSVVFKDVVPVLRKHCTECHGAGKAQGRVDLTSIAKMMGSKGKVLVPGMPDQSSLYTTIIDGEMPKDNKTVLTQAEKALVRDWIRGGAKE